MAFPAEVDFAAKPNSALRTAGLALFVAVMAYALAFAGDLFSLSPKIPAVLWPANPFQIAVMRIVPRKVWPLLIIAHAIGGIIHGFQIHITVLMTLIFTLADVVVFVVAGWGLDAVFDGIPQLDSSRAFARYSLIAVLFAPAVSAIVSGFGTPGLYWLTCWIWFLLNAVSFLVFGPAMFSWLSLLLARTRISVRRWLEAAALLSALLLLGCFIYFLPSVATPSALLYLLIPLLLWAALRFRSAGVCNSMVVVSILSVWGAVHGRGPFARSDPQSSSLWLVLFLLFATTPFILLAVVVEERERALDLQRALSQRLISAQEKERRRIARELHDDISQKLALLSLEVEQARRNSGSLPEAVKRALDGVREKCSELVHDLHLLSHELHSSNLEYLGIAGALGCFCEEFSQAHGVLVDFTQENVPRKLPQEVALCLFRIAQEALSNARRYSGTGELSVALAGKTNEIRLTVRDRGTGFDLEQVRRTGGLGLVSMEERAHLVGGELSIHSRPGAGTTIQATVPLSAVEVSSLEREGTKQHTAV